tara:strand:- start:601 stop:1092 length:492 start_codon:yes stop_codon:yes gene_type:complete
MPISKIKTVSIEDDAITAGKIVDGAVNADIQNNSIGITQLNLSDGSSGQAITTNGSGTIAFSSVGTSFTWESKTSAFNVASNKGYFVDTSGGAITATLPSIPSVGDIVRFIDLSATFDSNNLTVARNNKKIQGDASDMTVATERAGFSLVFSGDTQGWLLMEK